jgi:hypothetical protein
MPKINEQWGDCIRALLDRHSLTFRGAMLKVGGEPSHTTIKDWCDGIIPQDTNKAYKFLAAFPLDEALPCLQAAEIPVPASWFEPDAVFEELRGRLTGFTPEAKEQVIDFVKKMEQEFKDRNKDKHNDG